MADGLTASVKTAHGYLLRTLTHRSDMTGAERSWAARYNVGDVLQYNTGSNTEGIKRGSFATVRSVDVRANILTVSLDGGSTIDYDPRRLRGVNVFREVEREFSTGDRVQFTAPNKHLGVANRDLGTLASFEDGRMTLRMDGKTPRMVTLNTAEVRQFDHGYAVTSHSSQGLTADRILAHFDTESSRNLINSRLAYVAISRASNDARIYTNDVATLGERLSSNVDKTAALDVLNRIGEPNGIGSSIEIRKGDHMGRVAAKPTTPRVRDLQPEHLGISL